MSNPASIRAVRNNNPGNIRIGQPWQGLMSRSEMNAAQAAEREFCVFVNAKMGFRAMAEVFHTYHNRDGINTLRQAITRWAPPSENNTEAYIKSVCDYTGSGPDTPYPFNESEHMGSLCKAVSIHEVGLWDFQMGDLFAGVEAAG